MVKNSMKGVSVRMRLSIHTIFGMAIKRKAHKAPIHLGAKIAMDL